MTDPNLIEAILKTRDSISFLGIVIALGFFSLILILNANTKK